LVASHVPQIVASAVWGIDQPEILAAPPPLIAEAKKKSRWPRKMTWVLIIWCLLILVWAIGSASSNDCGSERSENLQSACEAGTGIGVLLVLFVFFSIIWFMTRPKDRANATSYSELRRRGASSAPRTRYKSKCGVSE
jgi:hypothetical protein